MSTESDSRQFATRLPDQDETVGGSSEKVRAEPVRLASLPALLPFKKIVSDIKEREQQCVHELGDLKRWLGEAAPHGVKVLDNMQKKIRGFLDKFHDFDKGIDLGKTIQGFHAADDSWHVTIHNDAFTSDFGIEIHPALPEKGQMR